MRWASLSLLAGLFAGCSDVHRSHLAGQVFCFPRNHLIADVPWVVADGHAVRESNGVAIDNCIEVGRCLLDRTVTSFTVDEGEVFHADQEHFAETLPLGSVTLAPDSERRLSEGGRLLAMRNTRIWPYWYVWRPGSGRFDQASVPNPDTDELVADCHEGRCNRDVSKDGILVSYSFDTEDEVPDLAEVQRLDEHIFQWIGTTTCTGERSR